jgi:L-threonylcarbamoyladenylate synthase
MPAHPLFLKLLRACGRPLAAPSANPFGYISPTSASHVRDSLGTRIGHILDGGEAAIGLESTILDLRDPLKPALLRPGAISARAISAVLGRRVRVATAKTTPPSPTSHAPRKTAGELAPGMLSKHYSPRTPISLHPRLNPRMLKMLPGDEAALFLFKPATLARAKRTTPVAGNVFWLAERGNLPGAARRLFGMLRALDDGRWKRIHAERATGRDGLALAINDRLTRAAAKG